MKFMFRLIAILLVLMIVGVGLIWFALPTERIGRIASDRLEAATGRTLTLSGEFSPSLWPNIGVSTGPLSVSNADWAGEPVFVSAQGASVAVDLMALIGGEIRIADLTLTQPVIQLERAADGRTNWTFEAGSGAPGEASSAPNLSALSATITQGRVRFVDGVSGATRQVEDINLTADVGEGGRAVTLDAAARVDGVGVALAGTAMFAEALGAGAVTLDMAAETDLGDLSYVGEFSDPATFGGTVQMSLPDPNAALALAGLAPLPAAAGALSDIDLTATVGAEAGAALIEGTGAVTRDGVRMDLTLSADGPVPGGPLAVDLRLVAEALAEVSFSGLVDLAAPGASGPLRVTAPSAADLVAWAARADVALPEGLRGPVQIAGMLEAGPARASLGEARIAIGDFDASGRIGVAMGARPRLDGDLSIATFNLDRFIAPGEGAAERAPAGSGWPDTPIPYELLDLADANLSLDVGALRQGDLALGRTRLGVVNDAGNLRLDVAEANGFGGVLTGSVGVNGPGEALDVDLNLGGVRLEQVLGLFAGTDRLEGQAALNADFTARGASVAALMQTLTGTIAADMADGALKGVNLAALARNFTEADPSTLRTDFTEAALSLNILNGAAEVSTLTAFGPLIRLGGDGTVGLAAQTLNLTLRPRIVGDLQGQGGAADASGITLPILVSGPWSDLSFRPDLAALEALTREAVEAEVDAAIDNAVDDARSQVQDRLREELGTSGEGDVEDQLREGLENRLRDGLGGLFR